MLFDDVLKKSKWHLFNIFLKFYISTIGNPAQIKPIVIFSVGVLEDIKRDRNNNSSNKSLSFMIQVLNFLNALNVLTWPET